MDKAPRRPRISSKVINGIIESTNQLLAGDIIETYKGSPNAGAIEDAVIAAHDWAFQMREWMQARGAWKGRR